LYEVEIVVAIGRFAEKRAGQVLKDHGLTDIKVISVYLFLLYVETIYSLWGTLFYANE